MRGILLLGSMGMMAAFVGCQSNAQFLTSNEPAAIRAAESRGRFELNCEEATAQILSEKVIEAPMGPFGGGGVERAEYTVGVRGCGKQVVYITICRDSANCNALSDTGRLDDLQ